MSILNIPFLQYPYNIPNPSSIKDFYHHNIHTKILSKRFLSQNKQYKFIIRKPTYCRDKNIFCVSTIDKDYMFFYFNMKYYRIDDIENISSDTIENICKKRVSIANNINELIVYILSIN